MAGERVGEVGNVIFYVYIMHLLMSDKTEKKIVLAAFHNLSK